MEKRALRITQDTFNSMCLNEIVATPERVSHTGSRLEKIACLAESVWRLTLLEIAIGVDYLMGRVPQGRLGVGPATLRRMPTGVFGQRALRIIDVNRV